MKARPREQRNCMAWDALTGEGSKGQFFRGHFNPEPCAPVCRMQGQSEEMPIGSFGFSSSGK